MSGQHILVVDDEPDIRELIRDILADEGYNVSVAENAAQARQSRQSQKPDLTLLDIWMPDTDGITLLKEWTEEAGSMTPVIMMSGHGTVETAVEATRMGAFDFIEKPLSMAKLLLAVRHGLENGGSANGGADNRSNVAGQVEPIGKSQLIRELREQLLRVAPHNTAILLKGQDGSGRETCARYVHWNSTRQDKPFMMVSADVLDEQSGYRLLFGDARGDTGFMQQADGGTLYISEIGTLPMELQAHLLDAIQAGTFRHADTGSSHTVNARLIASSQYDLEARVTQGRFREDLYYLLNIVPVNVPSLYQHREDVPELLEYFVDLHVTREQLPYRHFSLAAQNRLRNHEWPGNLRELSSLVQRLLINGNDGDIELDEVEQALSQDSAPEAQVSGIDFGLPLREARDQFERAYFEHHLRAANGNVTAVARHAGIERTHLYRKLRALGIGPKKK